MGGVVKLATGGKKKSIADIAPEPQKQTKQTVTKAETQAARERQAAFRARRGSGASLLGYGRTLGSQSPLEGEDIK
jgi:hypothetical protein